jgi:hypothetical protein
VVPVTIEYEIVFHACLPNHTSQDRPPMAAVLTREPNGRTGPWRVSQIISSAPSGWPLVPGTRLNQMS